ncbi:MAG: adenosine-specific kinase [Desulfovibrionaceae bacterium]
MELHTVSVENPEALNMILGMSHFIKTVEDVHEAVVGAVPFAKFGLAFCEASDNRLVRLSGTDAGCVELARANALAIGAGHSFILFMRDMFPINIKTTLLAVPEVVRLFCCTANPVDVVVAQTELGRGIMGVIDGGSPLGVETKEDEAYRKGFLRKIGYKF